ncbi:MAG: hypothetical protein P4M07_10960 [Xanthobacteraceae bacterium]|nr:hypothetical protein [Xanthobacteraceae bacterium]
MGIDAQGLRFLLSAKRKGVSFESPMMIGRQNFSTDLFPKRAADIFRAFGQTVDDDVLQSWGRTAYIEPLLVYLGAAHAASVDFSSYEGASVIHDMNVPIPDSLKGHFSVVIDSGTLEHIFNFPQALKNAMEMVSVGGHLLIVTGCNNWMGHGFYQFSPELFFRAFSAENGFVLDQMFICESDARGQWFRVSDPAAIGQRVELINDRPTYLLIQARRLFVSEIFAKAPQQSDYTVAWESEPERAPALPSPGSAPRSARQRVPEFVKRPVRWARRAISKLTRQIVPDFLSRPLAKMMYERQRAELFKITNKRAFRPVSWSEWPSDDAVRTTMAGESR